MKKLPLSETSRLIIACIIGFLALRTDTWSYLDSFIVYQGSESTYFLLRTVVTLIAFGLWSVNFYLFLKKPITMFLSWLAAGPLTVFLPPLQLWLMAFGGSYWNKKADLYVVGVDYLFVGDTLRDQYGINIFSGDWAGWIIFSLEMQALMVSLVIFYFAKKVDLESRMKKAYFLITAQ